MNKKIIMFCLAILLFSGSFSQQSKTIHIAPSISYRGALLELSNYPAGRFGYPGYSSEFYKQYGLGSIGIDISSTILKERLTINLSTYFRYGHLYNDPTLKKEVKSFKGDLFFDFLYTFRKKRENSFGFFVGAGFGKANIGTHFNYAFIPAIDANGNPYLKVMGGTFSFETARILVGLKKSKWVFTISTMGSPDEDKKPNLAATLEGKVAYNIFSFKIPVKKK